LITLRFHKVLLAGLLLLAGLAPASGQRAGAEATPGDLRAMDQRVAGIAHRLAVANLDLCADRRFLPGFGVHDLSQYDATARPSLIRTFGLDAGPGVLTLVPGGPAERAGLRFDDILLAADGQALPREAATRAANVPRLINRIHEALEGAFLDGRARLDVRRAGHGTALTVAGEPGCASRFEVLGRRGLQARADGTYVQITLGLAAYATDDGELAAILAHEFAHNVLRHRLRLDAANVQRGLLGNFGRNARLTRETELEADRLAPYLLDRAGYDPDAAVRFWRRFGNRGLNIFGSPTHGGWGRRAEAIQAEIALIRQARAAGRVPAPAFVQLPLAPLPAG
jgi:hypothetical protein